ARVRARGNSRGGRRGDPVRDVARGAVGVRRGPRRDRRLVHAVAMSATWCRRPTDDERRFEELAVGGGSPFDGGQKVGHHQFAQRVEVLTDGRQRRREVPGLRQIVERSEEHTSELQSREKLVCRLLLEKKNQITYCRSDDAGIA